MRVVFFLRRKERRSGNRPALENQRMDFIMQNIKNHVVIALTEEEAMTIQSALQVASYYFRDNSEKCGGSDYYDRKAEACWNLFEQASEWFDEYIDPADRR